VKNLNKKNKTGFSLIEFAISLAVLLPVLFGAVDINNTLRAYNALSKGNEVALRCIYPTDGACMEAANRAPKRLFNWFESQRSESYFVRDMQYRGSGEWLTSPRYIFDSYRARILNSVNFEVARYNVSATVPNRTVTQPVSVWVRRSGLPWVQPDNALNPLGRDVHFTTGSSNSSDPFPETNLVNNRVGAGGRVTRDNPSITYTFNLDNPLRASGSAADLARAVYTAGTRYLDNTDSLSANPIRALGARASQNPFTSSAGIKAIVRVKGSLAHLPANAASKLLISINGDQLGGQLMEDDGVANFYPRGYGLSAEGSGEVRVALRGSDFAAADEWTHEVILHAGINTIAIKRTNLGRGTSGQPLTWALNESWTIGEVDVYLPRFELATFNTSCSQGSCVSTPCTAFHGISVVESGTASAQYPAAVTAGPLSTGAGSGITQTNLGIFYSLPQAVTASSCALSSLTLSDAEPLRFTNQACPAANTGGVTNAQKMAACAPQHEALTQTGATLNNVSWSEREISLPESDAQRAANSWDFVFDKTDCNAQFNFNAPAGLAQYANYAVPSESQFNAARTTHAIMAGIQGRPSEAKTANQALSCDAIQIERMTFDGGSTPKQPANLPATSLFSGLQPERANSSECSLNLKNDAVQNGLPSEAWFTWEATAVREVKVTNRPTNSCTVFRQEIIENTNPSSVASLLPEGITPTQCATGNCQKTFAGLDSSVPANTQSGPDMNMARGLAYEAVVASYPRARKDCGGAQGIECLVTDIESDNAAAPKSVTVFSSMKVPLNLLGGNPVTVSNRQGRELETSFVR